MKLFAITTWSLFVLAMFALLLTAFHAFAIATKPLDIPIPWAEESTTLLYHDDPYQTQELIKMRETEAEEAWSFFHNQHRDPFEKRARERSEI